MPSRLLMLVFIIALFSSCVSQKDVTYFQALNKDADLQKIELLNKYINYLQPGDILSIVVNSLSPEATAMFNPYADFQVTRSQTGQSNAPQAATGYMVDEEGNIALPLVGKIKVSGLSTKDATDFISKKLEQFLVFPTVNVRIINFKVSILGEVARPSVYTIPNERVTLPEAIGLAGDLTIFGKRNNILIIRETDGKREFGRVSLNSRELFTSPFYYLRSNDVIYVEPVKGRITTSDRAIQLAPIILSSLSLLTIITVNLLR
jgi:polysaccharide biosynthesis/export protein